MGCYFCNGKINNKDNSVSKINSNKKYCPKCCTEWRKKVTRSDMDNIFVDTTAIVGNAPSEFGTGNGKSIDSFDNVIRFNNFKLGIEFEQDYGNKVDYWAHFAGRIKRRDNAIDKFKKVLIGVPINQSYWTGSGRRVDWEIVSDYIDIAYVIPLKVYKELRELMRRIGNKKTRLSGSPSTGLCLLYWVYKEQGDILYTDQIFGFNFLDTKQQHHYCDKQSWNGAHCGRLEKLVVDYLTRRKK